MGGRLRLLQTNNDITVQSFLEKSKTKATVKAKADSAKVVGKFGPYCAQCVL